MNNIQTILCLFIWGVYISKCGETLCQTFHPMSYATHRLYSFDKITSHELRNDIKDKLNTFVETNVKTLIKRFNANSGFIGKHSKNEYEESLIEQIKSLHQQAENKKKLSEKIQESHDKALRDLKKGGNEDSIDNEKKNKILKHNLEQIQYLNNRVQYLERKAQHLEKHLNEIKNGGTAKSFICNIQKSGTLNFVNSANALKHSINNVEGKLDEMGFTVYHKKEKKLTYYWNLIDMPIRIIGNVEQCFSFLYKNNNQIFCSKNKLKTASWINALVEGFLCYHFDIKGVAVNTNINSSKLITPNNPNVMNLNIKPGEGHTRINVDGIEHEIKDGEPFDLAKMKREIEQDRKNVQATEETKENQKEKVEATTEETKNDVENVDIL